MTLLLDVTIKMSVILSFALAAARLLRGQSAAVRHWTLAAAIACAAASPLVALVVPSWQVASGAGSWLQRDGPSAPPGERVAREAPSPQPDVANVYIGISGRSYATHLLELAQSFRAHRRAWFPAPAIARPSSLERRISAMLNSRVNREPVTPVAAVMVVAAVLGVTIPIAGFDTFAQTRFATVSGTATDGSGAVLVNATLVLSNVHTNAKYEVRTNQSGFFEFVGLPAGEYGFEARLPGFEALKDNVTLNVGESLQKSVTLRVGAVQEAITVISGPDAPVIIPRRDNRVVTARAPKGRPCPNPGVGGCIGPPVKVKDVRPVYPPELRGTGIEGTVLIEGLIGTDGRMKDMRIVSSPHPAFERSALDAVGEWEFTPTTLNDRAIDTRINVSVSFAQPPPLPPPPSAPPQ